MPSPPGEWPCEYPVANWSTVRDSARPPASARRCAKIAAVKYEYAFDPDAENNTAASIYRCALRGGKRVLDVGSGPAIVSRALAAVDGRNVTCIDSDKLALDEAAGGGVARTAIVDLESPTWHEAVRDERFDVVILADVLEHLRDPARLLRELAQANLLDPDARVVISVPNANHQSVLAELLSGDFRYTETGILDETHIRWFTLDSLTRLLESNGYVVGEVHRTLRNLRETTHGFRAAGLSEAARTALAELGLEGRTYQYVLVARPATEPGRLATLHDRVQAEQLRADEAARELHVTRSKLTETQKLLTAERKQYFAETALGAAELTAAETKAVAKAARRSAQAPVTAGATAGATKSKSAPPPSTVGRRLRRWVRRSAIGRALRPVKRKLAGARRR